MNRVSLDFKPEKVALALVEPSRKAPNFDYRQDKSGQSENRAVIVLWVGAVNVRTDVPELIEICDIGHTEPRKHESPRFRAGLGNESNLSCISRFIIFIDTPVSNISGFRPRPVQRPFRQAGPQTGQRVGELGRRLHDNGVKSPGARAPTSCVIHRAGIPILPEITERVAERPARCRRRARRPGRLSGPGIAPTDPPLRSTLRHPMLAEEWGLAVA